MELGLKYFKITRFNCVESVEYISSMNRPNTDRCFVENNFYLCINYATVNNVTPGTYKRAT